MSISELRGCQERATEKLRRPRATTADAMASYSLAEVAVPLTKGRSVRVAMYARPGAKHSSVLAISPPCTAEALDDDCFLHELWASLSDTNPGGGAIARFALFTDGSHDSWTEASSYSPEQLTRLRSFVRARLFDVWHGMAPELARLSGTFEMMNPAHGANMGWHQDGHGAAEYITHYYLGAGEASAPRPVAEGTGWCEVALPPLGAETAKAEAVAEAEAVVVGGEDEDEEALYELDFRSDGGLNRAGVSRANFVPFAIGSSTAAQRLVVFEDAGVFHRTPLTAYALPDLQTSRQRPMARVVCYGTSSDGSELRFEQPAHAAAPTPTPATAALPPGLHRALEAYAASQPQWDLADALDAYLRGDAELVRFLESGGVGR